MSNQQKRKKYIHEEDLLSDFEKEHSETDEENEDDIDDHEVLKDVKITETFPPRPPYAQYSEMGINMKLILRESQKIKQNSRATLVSTLVILRPIDDYCLLVQPNDIINNLFVAQKMFVFSRFTGRIYVQVQNITNNQVSLKAGTEIGEMHFIAFGIK